MDENITKRMALISIIRNLDEALQECDKLSDDYEEFEMLCRKIDKLLVEVSGQMLKI